MGHLRDHIRCRPLSLRGSAVESTAPRWTGGRRPRCGITHRRGPAWGYGGSGLDPARAGDPLSVTDEATAERFYERFKRSVIARIEAGPLDAGTPATLFGWREAAAGTDDFMRLAVAERRARGGYWGAHLPAESPERRETVAGECLRCQTQFAIDVRLPLPAMCPDCGADVSF